MKFEFGTKIGSEIDVLNQLIITAEEPKTPGGKDYRRFTPNQQCTFALENFSRFSFVESKEGNITHVYLVVHNEKQLNIIHEGNIYKAPTYGFNNNRTFNCKELSLRLEKAGVISTADRNILLTEESFDWQKPGTGVYRMTSWNPDVKAAVRKAQEVSEEQVAGVGFHQ